MHASIQGHGSYGHATQTAACTCQSHVRSSRSAVDLPDRRARPRMPGARCAKQTVTVSGLGERARQGARARASPYRFTCRAFSSPSSDLASFARSSSTSCTRVAKDIELPLSGGGFAQRVGDQALHASGFVPHALRRSTTRCRAGGGGRRERERGRGDGARLGAGGQAGRQAAVKRLCKLQR